MAANTPAFQYYPADLIADPDVMFWNMEMVGCYWQMITYLWLNGGKFDLKDESLRVLFHFKSKVTAIKRWELIKDKFILEGGVVTHKRVTAEIQRQSETRVKRSKAGKKGMEKRWKGHNKCYSSVNEVSVTKNNPSTPTPTTSLKEIGVGTTTPTKTPDEILELDLKIAKAKTIFTNRITDLFRPKGKEAVTFARVTTHLVKIAQVGTTGNGDEIFSQAIEWAEQAASSAVGNKKGLFVAKIKKETGFKAQERIL